MAKRKANLDDPDRPIAEPVKSSWDGRWHGMHRDSPPSHRRANPWNSDRISDTDWERLFITQEATARAYFARDSEAQELARVASIGGWEQQLGEFVLEHSRLPSELEEARLRAKSKRLAVDVRDNMLAVGEPMAAQLRELRTKMLGYWRRLIGLEA